jgi:hypothetical protein
LVLLLRIEILICSWTWSLKVSEKAQSDCSKIALAPDEFSALCCRSGCPLALKSHQPHRRCPNSLSWTPACSFCIPSHRILPFYCLQLVDLYRQSLHTFWSQRIQKSWPFSTRTLFSLLILEWAKPMSFLVFTFWTSSWQIFGMLGPCPFTGYLSSRRTRQIAFSVRRSLKCSNRFSTYLMTSTIFSTSSTLLWSGSSALTSFAYAFSNLILS